MLLFDQNISFKVAKKIQDIFPGAAHLSDLRMVGAKDIEIWDFAKRNDYCIVTYDFDFIDISTLKGFPPKIIWLRLGNTSTSEIILKFQSASDLIHDFLRSSDAAFLELK